MRAILVLLTLAVAAFVAWVAWQSHLSSLRAIVETPWDAPVQIWTSREAVGARADRPDGPLLDLEILGPDFDCHDEDTPEWVWVVPRQVVEARSALGEPCSDDGAEFALTKETRVIDGRTWHRWDLRRADR